MPVIAPNTPHRKFVERGRSSVRGRPIFWPSRSGTAQNSGASVAVEFVGPCPVCNGTDRFSVNTRKGLWNCRKCGEGGDVIRFVQHVIGATFVEAVATLTGETWIPKIPPARPRCCDDRADDKVGHNGPMADRIWRSTSSIRETLAEHYLVRIRGIDIEQIPNLDGCLRFKFNCPFGVGDELPCLIALVRDVVTGAPMGIVRTALDYSGQKIARRALGPKKSGAIKLWPDAAVTTGLVAGEGLETVAGAATRIKHRNTCLQPAWALIDRINLRDFPVLSGIEALTILVDNDQSGDGQDAADICTRRWLAAHRHVEQLIPQIVGTDFNDIAMGSVVR